ncbi:MAG: hypothetical protein O3C60_18365 [Planctomycetota bacterium]|nr:hypothetical protein [Planctomycetota bacterium]
MSEESNSLPDHSVVNELEQSESNQKRSRKGKRMQANESKIPLLKEVTCPTCWHEFPPEDVHWVAVHDDLVDDRFNDGRQLHFLPSRYSVKGLAYDERGRECTEMACPRCGNVFIPHLLQMEPLFLSILGAPGSGKSFFLAAMIRELQKTLGSKLNIRFQNSNPLGNRLITEYGTSLFDYSDDESARVKLQKTDIQGDLWYYQTVIDGQDTMLPKSYLYAVQPGREHAQFEHQDELSRVLCLYDNAGEHFLPGSTTGNAPVIDHLGKSEALLFVYDPLQESEFRRRCKGHSEDPQIQHAPFKYPQADVLAEAAAHIKRLKKLSATQLYDKPLIVVVQKCDAWESLVGDTYDVLDNAWRLDSEGQALLDADLIKAVSLRLQKLLLVVAPAIVNEAQAFCKEVVFIPVTATGLSPMLEGADTDGRPNLLFRPGSLKPRWCELPVLYALHRSAQGKHAGSLISKLQRKSASNDDSREATVPFPGKNRSQRG